MYRELLTSLTRENQWVTIQPPCPESEIEHAEKVVGYPFPAELKALLRELNGDEWLLLSAKRIIQNVELNRKQWLPFFESDFSKEAYMDRVDRFIFFATNGCGDYYGYRIGQDGIPEESGIYIWEHEEIGEECCWKKVASSIAELITRYYSDEI